jgi:hypothetical protein
MGTCSAAHMLTPFLDTISIAGADVPATCPSFSSSLIAATPGTLEYFFQES